MKCRGKKVKIRIASSYFGPRTHDCNKRKHKPIYGRKFQGIMGPSSERIRRRHKKE